MTLHYVQLIKTQLKNRIFALILIKLGEITRMIFFLQSLKSGKIKCAQLLLSHSGTSFSKLYFSRYHLKFVNYNNNTRNILFETQIRTAWILYFCVKANSNGWWHSGKYTGCLLNVPTQFISTSVGRRHVLLIFGR